MTKVRIGVIDFVNTIPLTRGLSEIGGDRVELVHGTPSALADKLRFGDVDVALIPVVEFLRGVGDGMVPGICIASDGAVESIRLLSRKPIEEIQRVLVDKGSRSSVAMLRLLLDRAHRSTPDFFSFQPDADHLFEGPGGKEDASLVIGDLAMSLPEDVSPISRDLGLWWQQTFHLPFVYAVWAWRDPIPGSDLGSELTEMLTASMERGLSELPQICAEVSSSHGWSEDRTHRYLTESIRFRLDGKTLDGLQLFHRLCRENYLAPQRPEIVAILDDLRRAIGGEVPNR